MAAGEEREEGGVGVEGKRGKRREKLPSRAHLLECGDADRLYEAQCPYCSTTYEPRLSWRAVNVPGDGSKGRGGGRGGEGGGEGWGNGVSDMSDEPVGMVSGVCPREGYLVTHSQIYLSPVTLRNELEAILQVRERERFTIYSPSVPMSNRMHV